MPVFHDPAPSGAPRRPSPAGEGAFARIRAAAAVAPLTEILPADPREGPAALGFALAWAHEAARGGLVVWAAPEASFAEEGVPHAEGLAQFGLDLSRLLVARTRTQIDALWAGEQALTIPGAVVLCTIAPAAKPISLTATRRLLLAGEKHGARCVLLRLDGAGASAAWTRWRIAAAPSQGVGRELGAPAFTVQLVRNRAGPSGLSWHVHWNARDHAFNTVESAMDGDMAAASGERSPAPRRRRAV